MPVTLRLCILADTVSFTMCMSRHFTNGAIPILILSFPLFTLGSSSSSSSSSSSIVVVVT